MFVAESCKFEDDEEELEDLLEELLELDALDVACEPESAGLLDPPPPHETIKKIIIKQKNLFSYTLWGG